MFFELKKVVLRDERTKTDSRGLIARYGLNGDLIFEGQDLGAAVKAFWGSSEYEWTWTIKAHDAPKLMQALKVRRNPLRELKRRFSGPRASGIETFLRDNAVPFLFWSRVGD